MRLIKWNGLFRCCSYVGYSPGVVIISVSNIKAQLFYIRSKIIGICHISICLSVAMTGHLYLYHYVSIGV